MSVWAPFLLRMSSSGLLKGIEVYYNQVYGGDVIFLHLCLVALIGATAQYTSEHLGMEGLHTATEDRGIGGHVLYLLTLVTQRFDELLSAASRQEFHTFFIEFLQQFIQAVFVEH